MNIGRTILLLHLHLLPPELLVLHLDYEPLFLYQLFNFDELIRQVGYSLVNLELLFDTILIRLMIL